ncbi:MAG TPA: hypothetical protein EYH44_03330, partial [Thermoprotei archaeon]|nr:hypothetical protein [Thermoprotei archaeon]
DSEYWLKILKEYNVPSAPVNRISEFLESIYTVETDLIGKLYDPILGETLYIRPPIKIEGSRPYTEKYPPSLSEDAREILTDLGYGEEDIKKFYMYGIVK